MGLPAVHIRVAEAIGYDAFIAMWRIYESDPFIEREPGARGRVGDGAMVVRLRSFRSYLRYQRNRFVEALADMGLTWQEIQRRVAEELCEKVSRRHITRLMKGE